MGAVGGPSWAPIRKVLIGTLGGLPVGLLVPVAFSALGITLPEPLAGLIGAAAVALITYWTKPARGEVTSLATPEHCTPINPNT